MTVKTTQDNIIELIQEDILNPEISLEIILLKAKVLAHQLKNKDLQQWIKFELEGYPVIEILPDYRIVQTPPIYSYIKFTITVMNVTMPTADIPEKYRLMMENVHLTGGVKLIEDFSLKYQAIWHSWDENKIKSWYSFYSPFFDSLYPPQILEVKQEITPSYFSQILIAIKSRLQNFILELSDLPWEMSRKNRSVRNEVEKLVSVIIYNNPQGGSVTTFDQRNQQVTNQNNAARDIYLQGDTNISNIDNINDLISEVRKLKKDLEQQASNNIVDAEIVDDVDLELANTIQELKKNNPDRNKIITYFQKAKNLLADVADAAKYGKIIFELIEIVKNIF